MKLGIIFIPNSQEKHILPSLRSLRQQKFVEFVIKYTCKNIKSNNCGYIKLQILLEYIKVFWLYMKKKSLNFLFSE